MSSILFSGFAVSVLVLIPWVGVWALDLRVLFGVIVPYAAMATFFVGIVVRVIDWGKSPVPFRIPTTAGQEWSFPWIKSNPIDNPRGTGGVIVRMILEVLLFRSLFRNTRLEYRNADGSPRIDYEWEKWLWLAYGTITPKRTRKSNAQTPTQGIKTSTETANPENRIDDIALLAFDIYSQCRQKIYEIRVNEVKNQLGSLLKRANLTFEIPEQEPEL